MHACLRFALLAVLLPLPPAVRPAATPRAPAPDAGDVRRQLDFWVGTWDVLDPNGDKIGSSVIENLEDGWLILENWTDAKGGTGKSMNFVDPEDGRWKQVWVSGDYHGVVEYDGEYRDGAMRFEGKNKTQGAPTQLSRCTFTPLDAGEVHQVIERSTDGGKTWPVAFDGIYVHAGR